MEYQSLEVRSRRRIWVIFTGAYGVGADDPTLFTVTCNNALGADPPMQEVLPYDDTTLELVLTVDLAPGGMYQIDIGAVPGAPPSTPTTAFFTANIPPAPPSENVSIDDLAGQVFRVDVRHDGTNMIETAAGDLATATGQMNVKDAVVRRLISEGLPHTGNYGAHARDSIDGPPVSLGKLAGQLQAQARLDPRVISASITAAPDNNDGTFVLTGQLHLVGGALIDLTQEALDARR